MLACLMLLFPAARFLFDRSMYQDMQRTARGAFAQVFTCHAPSFCMGATELAVKLTDLPTTAGDNSMSQVRNILYMSLCDMRQRLCLVTRRFCVAYAVVTPCLIAGAYTV